MNPRAAALLVFGAALLLAPVLAPPFWVTLLNYIGLYSIVALGLVLLTGGSYREAVLGGVNYGRDADSIASMAGAIAGALSGVDTVPAEWRQGVSAASKTDIEAPGRVMATLAVELAAADAAQARARESAMTRLADQ